MSDPELQGIRATVDNLDAAWVHALAARFALTERIGEIKADKALPALDADREAGQRDRLRVLSEESGLDPQVALDVYSVIVAASKRNHDRIRDSK